MIISFRPVEITVVSTTPSRSCVSRDGRCTVGDPMTSQRANYHRAVVENEIDMGIGTDRQLCIYFECDKS